MAGEGRSPVRRQAEPGALSPGEGGLAHLDVSRLLQLLDVLGQDGVRHADAVADYAELMESLFDFPALKAMFADGFRMSFDAMSAVTGPYAHEILENRLGAAEGTVKNGTPLPDFGNHHPDPNLVHAKALYDEMMGADAPDFGAASEVDGDRGLIVNTASVAGPGGGGGPVAYSAAKSSVVNLTCTTAVELAPVDPATL